MFNKVKSLSPAKIAEKQFKKIKLSKNDIAIDCGANVGRYTKFLARKNSTVYAFEPNPYAFGALSYKFRKQEKVHCINKGVMDQPGELKFYLRNNSSENPLYWSTSSSFMTYSKNLNYDSYLSLECIDLCDFIKDLGKRIRILKMDIEGAELKVLKKLIETDLINNIDYVFVEMHDDGLPELKEESDEIRNMISERKLNHVNLDWK